MTKCKVCKRSFPDEVFQPAFIDGKYLIACPLCVYDVISEVHGIPNVRPHAPEAKRLYKMALSYVSRKVGKKI